MTNPTSPKPNAEATMKLHYPFHISPTRHAALCLAALSLSASLALAATPANPVVELRFSEGPDGAGGAGVVTTNNGTLAGNGTFAQPVDPDWETNLFPIFSTNVPRGTFVPSGNTFSVNMGTVSGNSFGGSHGRAVDVVTELGPFGGTLGGMPGLTICGWLNASTLAEGAGGNRIAYALETAGGLGFDLVQRLAGQLGLYINGYSAGPVESLTGLVTADGANGTNNWVFFAVTYDPSLGAEQVKFFSGKANRLASLNVARDFVPSPAAIEFTGNLTIGNFSPVDGAREGTGSISRIFRGLIDEITIYTNALSLNEIQQAQLNSAVPPTAVTILQQPASATAADGQNAAFSALANGSGLVTYQWKTNGVDVPGATNLTLTLSAVTLPESGKIITCGISNSLGGLLSNPATLTVIPNDPFVGSFSFSGEPTATSAPNLGSLGGVGLLRRVGGHPVFVSTNVPSGPAAPSPVHNRSSMHFNVVGGNNKALDLTNSIVSPDGSLGSMNAITICGWLSSSNATFRTTSTGRGNAVLNASKGGTLGGFILGYRSDSLGLPYGQNGRLQFHVNEFAPDVANNLSSVGKVPLNADAYMTNWVFFAVTYDGQSAVNNLSFYFGDVNNLAALDITQTYNKGVIASTGPLTIGNHNTSAGNPTGRAAGGEPNGTAYRGLMDEIKIYSRVLTLPEIQAAQTAAAVPQYLQIQTIPNNLVITWDGPNQLMTRPDAASGSWTPVPYTPAVSGNIRSLTLPPTNSAAYFRLRSQ